MSQQSITPFKSISPFAQLIDPHPDKKQFRISLKASSDHMIQIMANLWISEGFPAVFIKAPYRYDQARIWIAETLGINSKEITVVGSARFGYSLKPQKYGIDFSPDSDLDLAITSEELFDRLKSEFINFCNHYKESLILPRSDFENKCWSGNIKFIEQNLPKFFMDIDKIPNSDRYPTSKFIKIKMSELQKEFERTSDCPTVKKVSIRVYRNLKAFQSRLNINLSDIRSKI